MSYSIYEVAFAGLIHDIGKFYQRTMVRSDLTENELRVTPIAKDANYHTHLHSGYTSRFLKKYLRMYNDYERIISSHHLNEENGDLDVYVKNGDRIASSIDRKDEQMDYESANSKGHFLQTRLTSVLSEVDLGKKCEIGTFELSTLHELDYPVEDYELESKEKSAENYKELFDQMIQEIEEDPYLTGQVDRYLFDRIYALMYQYTTLIPASTYEGNRTYVSLFDHSKLTSAIASCLYRSSSEANTFNLLEFDVSGIQKFIFKVTEGAESKQNVAKSLRGRSFFVSLITNIITYTYLHEFGLTQSNILFNTGGGALLLLPSCPDYEERINKVTKKLQKALFDIFYTDLTFVVASVSCTRKELEDFKAVKSVELKTLLENKKATKFSSMMNDDFFFKKNEKMHVCSMCQSNFTDGDICHTCRTIEEISNFLVKHKKLYLLYTFQKESIPENVEAVSFSLGYATVYLIDEKEYSRIKSCYEYIESLNHVQLGNTRFIANSVPLKNNRVLSFEEISEKLIDDSWGDKKLGILKMDVDNLGTIFAYGLPAGTRSISKYLTMSRLFELFFGKELIEICEEVSENVNHQISNLTDNGTMFYINYAGGDDLVIIGPAAAILQLAETINYKLEDFTLNDNITISGGIFIQKPKEPIRFGIQKAEEYLNSSKSLENKNGLTLIDTTCSFEEYSNILSDVFELKDYIDQGHISRTNFYGLMTAINVDEFNRYLRSIPIITYSLKRNVSNEGIRKKLIEKFSKTNNMEDLSRLVLEMKLVIMQTRGERDEK